MKKIILSLIITVVGMFGMLSFVAAPVSAVTCPPGAIRGSAATYAECNTDSTQTGSTLTTTIGKGINTVLGLIGIVAVVMMIYGGFQFLTSAGDAAKVAKAKNIVMYSVVGLVVAVLAYAIVNFVLSHI